MIIQPTERFKRLDTVSINKIEYSFAYEVYISNLYKINISESALKQIKNKRSWKHIVL